MNKEMMQALIDDKTLQYQTTEGCVRGWIDFKKDGGPFGPWYYDEKYVTWRIKPDKIPVWIHNMTVSSHGSSWSDCSHVSLDMELYGSPSLVEQFIKELQEKYLG